ncbi:MAG: TolB family protein [Actinomycetota bacterium]
MPRAAVIAAAGALALAPLTATAATGDVARLGWLPDGSPASASVQGAAFSPDGRYALITSTAALSGTSTGGVRQLFMRDRATGRTAMVSTSASGQPASAAVDDPDPARAYGVSLDGRYVVFATAASNLVAGDLNGAIDVFRKDTQTGRVLLVSRDSRGDATPGGVTGQPSISADGSKVAFTSGTAGLLAADTNGVADVYVADVRAGGTLALVSRTSGGVQSPEAVGRPSISADGRSIAFEGPAAASVLAQGDADGFADIYVARPQSRTIVVASVPGGGTDNGDSSLPSISGDGSLVAFSSAAALVATDAGADRDAYVRDLEAGTTRRVSGETITNAPAISTNGARVAFAGATTGGDADDANVADDVYVRTLATNALYRASRTASGAAPSQPSTRAAISGSGGMASFTTAQAPGGLTDAWTTDVGAIDTGAPLVTASAALAGRRLTVSGRVSDDSGVTSVMVGRRAARIADDGAYGVTYTAPVGTESVTVQATNGLGATASATTSVTRTGASRGRAQAAPRPRGLRVTVARPWARVAFTLPGRASWRVEMRRRVQGPARAAAFRLVASRSGPAAAGRRTVRMRIPAATPAGRYQVRVLASSALGLGTTARTITVP